MIGLDEFKINAKKHGICKMVRDWDKATNKKQLIDLALSIRGIEYLAKSISEGWGLSPDYIAEEFAAFNDGQYVRDLDGYTTCFYCLYDKPEIEISTTATLIIDYNGVINVCRPICELYICNSNVTLINATNTRYYPFNSQITLK